MFPMYLSSSSTLYLYTDIISFIRMCFWVAGEQTCHRRRVELSQDWSFWHHHYVVSQVRTSLGEENKKNLNEWIIIKLPITVSIGRLEIERRPVWQLVCFCPQFGWRERGLVPHAEPSHSRSRCGTLHVRGALQRGEGARFHRRTPDSSVLFWLPPCSLRVPQAREKLWMALGEAAPVLVPVSHVMMCMNCTTDFSLTLRRHHCNACGKVSSSAPQMLLRGWSLPHVFQCVGY